VVTGPRTALGDTNPRRNRGEPVPVGRGRVEDDGSFGGGLGRGGRAEDGGFGGGRRGGRGGAAFTTERDPGSLFPTIAAITDGTSNTILAIEARRDIPWTKPEDLDFRTLKSSSAIEGFRSDGFNALFCDGSVRFIKNSVVPSKFQFMLTRDGREVLQAEDF
jgi:prepilin-type processing-associated H-X9-DG protein